MEEFLSQRRGYCEQFAGTYAAFARVLGLPSRVAIGFTPGERRDDGRYYVQGKHAHAWPEIYFEGVGWVPFEPTPGRGVAGAEQYTGVAADQADG
jgi:transglutaminase-like putative cysteine protease